MPRPHLVLANKNYSSWSLRPWIAMTVTGIAFTEEVIPLDRPDTKERIAAHSRAGRLPVLHHGKITVWESLAILEYLAETYPEAGLWPRSRAARALARSVANEMHAGFLALRSACPMNMRRPQRRLELPPAAMVDVRRIEDIWRTCREAHGRGGPFLFGRFSAADAMYAPVVNRLDVYDVTVSSATRTYMEAVKALPAWQAWHSAAMAEPWIITADEA